MSLDLMKSRIEKARAGDTKSAQALLRNFVLTVRKRTKPDGTPHVFPTGSDIWLPWEYAQYFAEGFEQVLNGVDAGKALGIASGESGRPALSCDAINSRDVDLVLAVLKSKRINSGEPLPFHFKRVAEQLKVYSARQVKSAWENSDMREVAQLFEEMALKLD